MVRTIFVIFKMQYTLDAPCHTSPYVSDHTGDTQKTNHPTRNPRKPKRHPNEKAALVRHARTALSGDERASSILSISGARKRPRAPRARRRKSRGTLEASRVHNCQRSTCRARRRSFKEAPLRALSLSLSRGAWRVTRGPSVMVAEKRRRSCCWARVRR